MRKDKSKKNKHKVFIVDDHLIVREGLAQLINREEDLTVCGEAGNVSEALEQILLCNPDIVTVDITLEHGSGIRLISDLAYSRADLSILVLSMHDETIYAERCLKAGASGYIMKQEPSEKMISALRKVLNGGIYVSDKLKERLMHKFTSKKYKDYASSIDILSDRELEVFQLIGKGLKNQDIAEQLNLSVKTVETYIDHIKKKMNFKNSRELIMHAVKSAC